MTQDNILAAKKYLAAKVLVDEAREAEETATRMMVRLFGSHPPEQFETLAKILLGGPKPKQTKPRQQAQPRQTPASAASPYKTLREYAKEALAAHRFPAGSEEIKLLRRYLSQKDGRTPISRGMAAQVAELLGRPLPRKPGPAPQSKPRPRTPSSPRASTPTLQNLHGEELTTKIMEILGRADSPMTLVEVIQSFHARGYLPCSDDHLRRVLRSSVAVKTISKGHEALRFATREQSGLTDDDSGGDENPFDFDDVLEPPDAVPRPPGDN